MRAPAPGGTDGRRGGGDWWTGIADWREAERIKVKNGGGEGVLERFAADGGKFGMFSSARQVGIGKRVLIFRIRQCCLDHFVRWVHDGSSECADARRIDCAEGEPEGAEMEGDVGEAERRVWELSPTR